MQKLISISSAMVLTAFAASPAAAVCFVRFPPGPYIASAGSCSDWAEYASSVGNIVCADGVVAPAGGPAAVGGEIVRYSDTDVRIRVGGEQPIALASDAIQNRFDELTGRHQRDRSAYFGQLASNREGLRGTVSIDRPFDSVRLAYAAALAKILDDARQDTGIISDRRLADLSAALGIPVVQRRDRRVDLSERS